MFNTTALAAQMRSMPSMRFLLGGTGSGPKWEDQINGYHASKAGSASCNGTYATFPGGAGDYFTFDASPPTWASTPTAFATRSPDYLGWSTYGISVICLMRVQSGDLASRTLIHWKNTLDETRWMVRFDASGQLQFWNQYSTDTTAYYTETPPGDRFFTIPIDLRPYLCDGKWHLFQFGRGAVIPNAESKRLMIDFNLVYEKNTGNSVNGFTSPDGSVHIGRNLSTTIPSDPAQSPFKGDMTLFTVRPSDTSRAEMVANAMTAGGAGISLRDLRRLRALRR